MSLTNGSDFKLTPELIGILRKCDPDVNPLDLNINSLQDVWKYLKKEEKDIDAKLNLYKSKDINLQQHMEQLHQYNDIKDITQEVLGHLANRLNISVVEAHHKFDLHD